jgi:hypothetical protein
LRAGGHRDLKRLINAQPIADFGAGTLTAFSIRFRTQVSQFLKINFRRSASRLGWLAVCVPVKVHFILDPAHGGNRAARPAGRQAWLPRFGISAFERFAKPPDLRTGGLCAIRGNLSGVAADGGSS